MLECSIVTIKILYFYIVEVIIISKNYDNIDI